MPKAWLVFTLAGACLAAQAQQPIGTINPQDATIAGDLSVTNGRTVLVGSSSVTAKDHTAEIALERGGRVRVCATSGLHLAKTPGNGAQPLLLALDRGAIEVETVALSNDTIMTPDLRFSVHSGGPLNLRMRVTPNGDTCVENKGGSAPVLGITDQFGEASYELKPGQHVLFEHGSLREVVDHETSDCGCPPAAAPGMSVADALLKPGDGTKTPSQKAAEEHPFPAAVSQGLAPPPPTPAAPPGQAHAQVSTTLGYGSDGGTVAGTPAATAPPPAPAEPAPDQPAKEQTGFFHSIGHFFRHLFGK